MIRKKKCFEESMAEKLLKLNLVDCFKNYLHYNVNEISVFLFSRTFQKDSG